jgi:nucleoside-diphosphate-sugar epimerase
MRSLLSDPGTEHISILDTGRTALLHMEFLDDRRVELHSVDARETSALAFELLRNPFDIAIQLAVSPLVYSISEPFAAFDDLLGPQRALLECARLGYVPRLLLFSSSEVYGGGAKGERFSERSPLQPRTAYAAAKAGADLLADSYRRCYGTAHVTLRLFNQIGAGKQVLQRGGIVPQAIKALRDGSPLNVYNPNATRDFVPIADTIRAIRRAISAFDDIVGETINICSGTYRSVESVVADIETLTASSIARDVTLAREGDVDHLCGDGRRALELLGFQVQTSWLDALRAVLDGALYEDSFNE